MNVQLFSINPTENLNVCADNKARNLIETGLIFD